MKKIQDSYESTTKYVNDLEAWNDLKFRTSRPFVNDNKLDSHIIAAGDVKSNNKTYRLSLWTDRLYISEPKKVKNGSKKENIVLRECYSCMIGPGKPNPSDENEDLVTIIIYSCLTDDKTKKFQAWEPKRFEFVPSSR